MAADDPWHALPLDEARVPVSGDYLASDLVGLTMDELTSLFGHEPSDELLSIRSDQQMRLQARLDTPLQGPISAVFRRTPVRSGPSQGLPVSQTERPSAPVWVSLRRNNTASTGDSDPRLAAAIAATSLMLQLIHMSSCRSEYEQAQQSGQSRKWSDLFADSLARRFDYRGVRSAISFWKRWKRWHSTQTAVANSNSDSCDPVDLAIFFQDVYGKRRAAVNGILASFKWLQSSLGLQLPLHSPLLLGLQPSSRDALRSPWLSHCLLLSSFLS